MKFTIQIQGRQEAIEVHRRDSGWECHINGQALPVDVVEAAPGVFSLLLDGQSFEVHVEAQGQALPGHYRIHTRNADLIAEIHDPRRWRGKGGESLEKEGAQEVTASMPGKVIRVLVKKGDEVEKGQGLVVIEAMKMQNEIPSPKAGVIEKVLVEGGETVEHGARLVVVR